MIKKSKHDYYINTLKAAGNGTNKLLQISNSLLGRITPRILPDRPYPPYLQSLIYTSKTKYK